MAFFSTRWTAGDGVVPYCAGLGVDVVENTETWPIPGFPHHRFSLGWGKQRWDDLPGNQSGKLFMGQFGKRIQVTHLLLKVFTGTVKPKALRCTPVNAQRPTDGTAVPAGLQRIVLGEDLDSFLPALLDRNT